MCFFLCQHQASASREAIFEEKIEKRRERGKNIIQKDRHDIQKDRHDVDEQRTASNEQALFFTLHHNLQALISHHYSL